jgi:hypothetical protein
MQLLQARPPIPPTPTGESSQYSLQHSPHPLPSAPPLPSQPAAGQSREGGGQLTPFHYEQLGLKMQTVNASLVSHVLDKIGLGGGRDTLSLSPEEKVRLLLAISSFLPIHPSFLFTLPPLPFSLLLPPSVG